MEKETHQGITSDGIQYGVTSMLGRRNEMEDSHITETRLYAAKRTKSRKGKWNKIMLPNHSLFAVFDGRGGTFASEYASKNFCRVLSRQPLFAEYAEHIQNRPVTKKEECTSLEFELSSGIRMLKKVFCDAFVDIDKEIACAWKGSKDPDADIPYHDDEPVALPKTKKWKVIQTAWMVDVEHPGTTACVVLLTPDYIVCANAGDCRAVLHSKEPTYLSYDHKPDYEKRRIIAAGGTVVDGRVGKILSCSRGFGDYDFKNMDVVMAANNPVNKWTAMLPGDQQVSSVPDVIVKKRCPSEDEFIIIACDGIWDVFSNNEAVKTISRYIEENKGNLGRISEMFCECCFNKDSKDNMTAIIVKFNKTENTEGTKDAEDKKQCG